MVDKTPLKIRTMFDQISPRYDFLNHLLSLNSDVLWRRRAAALCEGAKRVLDVCSGTGDMALEIQRRWGADVVGSDFAYRMLEIAKLKAERRSLGARVRFQQADTLRLPYKDGSFDAATVAFGIRNVIDTERGIGEMTRVLRPGGRVVILEFTLPENALLRQGYLAYFGNVLPRLGRMIARSEIDAYKYLPDSVARWPRPDELKSMMERSGLGSVSYDLIFGGVAAIHTGLKA
ncbi:MAG TPA: bifunctional demethylmenaquinone methyltransferase/2-methoxy-6-polyprenyl-1,4-benzoquinol methylase UbiE [Planctomycetota bacterium]|nr:bifunctional demethylmenaquinone methyltransferase/2-methoxy-6-polyprenyl-1,4-benzoquinol methylase UbiE [Planctomycetota bacterium]